MRAAALLLAALLPCGAAAQQGRYAMMPDASGGGLWVVDGDGGRVARCREGEARSPRVVDITGGTAVARDRGGAGSEPICTGWVTIAAATPRGRPKVLDAGN